MPKTKTEATVEAAQIEQGKYSREELQANVEALFGVKKEVLVAAMSQDKRTEYSVDEAKALIKNFMKRKVI